MSFLSRHKNAAPAKSIASCSKNTLGNKVMIFTFRKNIYINYVKIITNNLL